MTKRTVQMKEKIQEAGSMMVEAMAMLALISLVTPTLYKKSAERTTELQDINTATQLRTIINAADNYVAANYDKLTGSSGIADGASKAIVDFNKEGTADHEFMDYLPYGYDFDNGLKNFQKPVISVRRDGDSLTTMVEFPAQNGDIVGNMRAARIASMVGSNGGYIQGGVAKGVGGIWEVKENELKTVFGAENVKDKSIVAISSEAINSNTNDLKNYLQRTKAEAGEKWRNTMVTDLYMGGYAADGESNSNHGIYNVNQMIIGGGKSDADADLGLLVGGDKDAVIEGALDVYNDFVVRENGGDTYFSITGIDDAAPEFDFSAQDGSIIYAQQGEVQLLGGDLTLTNNGADERELSLFDGQLTVNDKNSKVRVQASDSSAVSGVETLDDSEMDGVFEVAGNAAVQGRLRAGEIQTKKMDMLNLTAGGESFDGMRWLHANKDGVKVLHYDTANDLLAIDKTGTKMFYTDATQAVGVGDNLALYYKNHAYNGKPAIEVTGDQDGETTIYNVKDQKAFLAAKNTTGIYYGSDADHPEISKVELSNSEAIIDAPNKVKLFTNEGNNDSYPTPNDTVDIQQGAILATGQAETGENAVVLTTKGKNKKEVGTISMYKYDISLTSERENEYSELLTDPEKITLNVYNNTDNSYKSTLDLKDNLTVTSKNMELDSQDMVLKRVATADVEGKDILRVDLDAEGSSSEHNASVYIRKGAIEVQGRPSGTPTKTVADEGIGYVMADRFVVTDNTRQPLVYAGDQKYEYDRYMVNPAYTSVMHDIALTSRGGARLSDILPDFINKGIYVVNNTYAEPGADGSFGTGTKKQASDLLKMEEIETNGSYAAPYLGAVPVPACPAGYAKVLTLTPAGFMMSQAGSLQATNGTTRNYVVSPTGDELDGIDANTIAGAQAGYSVVGDNQYLGGSKDDKLMKPFYFQQSTWLKSKIIPVDTKGAGANNLADTTNSANENRRATYWKTFMGFLYPKDYYEDLITLTGGSAPSEPTDGTGLTVYWNLLPVMTGTLEGYATVYCYFDKAGILNKNRVSDYNPEYVDTQYEPMEPNGEIGGGDPVKSSVDDDPALTYSKPW